MESNQITKYYFNFFVFFLFFLTYYFFYLSLEKCNDGEDICCQKFGWMKKKIIEELISCILSIILLEAIILKILSKFHLLHFGIIFCFFYIYSHGIRFHNHGYYNIIYFFLIVISFLILISITKCILYIKKKKILLLYIETILILLYSFRNLIYIISNCEDWKFGLNNTSIDNDNKKYECMIQTPKYCLYKIGKYFFDRNRFSNLNCSSVYFSGSRNKILSHSKSPFINKNTKHIGFPLTNKEEKFFYDMDFQQYRTYIFQNLIDMDNLTLLNSLTDRKPEISIDFSLNKNGKMIVDLNFNQTLSEERKRLEYKTNSYSKNIMILYLDSVSRANSIRQLKKTLGFFEKFMQFGGMKHPKFPNENFHSFQFFKYHSHKYFTIGNYPILFYGNHRNETNKYITLYLKKNGYITGYSSDNCDSDFTKSYHNFTFEDTYDHRNVLCDPNYWGPLPKIQCMYGKFHVEFMFEYISQFWEKYQNNRKFALFLTNFAHEGTLEKLKYIDKLIYNYLNELFNKNYLKETSIFLLSDHGVAIPSIYYLNNFFQYELVLPMFYLFINDRKNISYDDQYKYIYQNQQTFITGFDIYNTIVHLIYGDKYGTKETEDIISPYGKSLFNEIIQKNRTPKNYILMSTYACV